jgi:hypothetical protein
VFGGSEQMRLTSTGLGIGTSSPLAKLHSNNSASGAMALTAIFSNQAAAALNNGSAIFLNNSSSFSASTYSARIASVMTNGTTQAADLIFGLYNGSGLNDDLMRLTSSGNLGLGVTPSAWNSTYKALQLQGGSVASESVTLKLYQNAYVNAAGNDIYSASLPATIYTQYNGEHRWSTAPSGTAGDAISFSQVMTLDADGDLGIGSTSPGCRIDVVSPNNTSLNPTIRVNSNNVAVNSALAYDGLVGSGEFELRTSSASALKFGTNNTERARIDSSGNLGLGVTPSAWTSGGNFDLGATKSLSASDSNINLGANFFFGSGGFTYKTTGNASYYNQGAGLHRWFTAPSGTAGNAISFTQAMTLDASGNLGLGTTTTNGRLSVYATTNAQIALTDSTLGVNYGGAVRGYGVGGQGGFIELGVLDSSTYVKGILVAQQATSVQFFTGTSGSGSSTERARIDSSGNLLVGTTSTSVTTGGMFIQPGAGGETYYAIGHNTGTSSGAFFAGYYYAGSNIGSITQSGTTAVLYNVTSDQRLKENIVDAPEFGSVIDSIKVRSYDWKTDQTHQRAGFIAQELVTVAPEAVHQPADPEEMMAVDYSKLVPMLVKEIQSLRARLAAANI